MEIPGPKNGVWQEDDAPDREGLDVAYKRLFGEQLLYSDAVAEDDQGRVARKNER